MGREPGTFTPDMEQAVLEQSDYVAALEDVLAKAKRVVTGHRRLGSFLELEDAIRDAELLR